MDTPKYLKAAFRVVLLILSQGEEQEISNRKRSNTVYPAIQADTSNRASVLWRRRSYFKSACNISFVRYTAEKLSCPEVQEKSHLVLGSTMLSLRYVVSGAGTGGFCTECFATRWKLNAEMKILNFF